VTEIRSAVRHPKLALADGTVHLFGGAAPRRIGLIDKATMRDFDATCVSVPPQLDTSKNSGL
jgi:hypothetical protein